MLERENKYPKTRGTAACCGKNTTLCSNTIGDGGVDGSLIKYGVGDMRCNVMAA